MISKSPDKFNDHFSKKGWIAHESMNHDLMLTCIEFAHKGQIELAEQKLINYYSSDKMHWLTYQLKGTKEFSIRYSLIKAAYEDTIAEILCLRSSFCRKYRFDCMGFYCSS